MVTSRPDPDSGVAQALLAAAGLLFTIAIGGLVISGHTMVRFSSDEAAEPYPLWMPLTSSLMVLLLTRLVPMRLAAIDPLADIGRERLTREVRVLVCAALAFPVLVVAAAVTEIPRDAVYSPIKVLMFLVIPLLAFRVFRGGVPQGPKARWTSPLDRTRLLAPIVPVVAWIALARLGPLAPPATSLASLPDPVTIAVASLITLLTAGVLEEVFYRGFLQTRLESLVGRWPAIATSSVLFAAMHIASHVRADTVAVDLATIVAVQGTFGVMQGYLWSRYRNIWAPIAIHIAVNLIYLDMLIS
ncbi:CAAX amino terminal protease self- immunity [Mycobacteroides salmoniphilum]|uniref:CPBP family intramembrane glutamic endopeptidase n=1 Tax=Mycobacteroides salmoniphilum TaxID=404941 RepID=UPI0010A9B96B|nr:type II CAAX endopeptidase family protein [Mycobacteroides salmoniphilum]QCH25650.1 CAAX amino terminal protease self- immunity [Mycobacteroides salmoniphilum]